MSLDFAADHLRSAVSSLATSERPMGDRLQTAWTDDVQMLWMKPCLTVELLIAFREIWQRYTAPSDDRRSTQLRALTHVECVQATHDLLDLWQRAVHVAARATGEEKLATLADLAVRVPLTGSLTSR